MKKIYSKMTKERAQAYQIETSIYFKDGIQVVRKTALNSHAEPHINRMYEYYEKNKSKDILVPARKIKSGCVEFDFVKGKTLYKKIIEAAEQKDIEKLNRNLDLYKDIIAQLYPKTDFFNTGTEINVDISFDNIIIKNEKAIVIDYEWIFDNIYTIGFGIYRAVTGLYSHDGHLLNEIMSLDEMLKYLGIGEHKESCLIQNKNFNNEIFGKKSYNDILTEYKKDNFNISDIIGNSDTFTQIYFDYGEGYSEEKSACYELHSNQVDLKIKISDAMSGLRVDLCNFPFVAKNIKIYAIVGDDENEIVDYMHNSIVLDKKYYWFWDSDPQIILNLNAIGFSKIDAIRIYVEKIDVVKDQDALSVSELLGEHITEKLQKKDEETARIMEETVKSHQRDLEEHRSVIDEKTMQLNECKVTLEKKEKMCEQYRTLAETLIARLNKVNADYRISKYKLEEVNG